MSTGLWILIVILAAVAGVVGGFFFARRYMQNYLKNNPPISEEMLRTMMLQMGQKPSEKKLKQMLATMQSQARNS
ncbi:YneF family protein [Furfurilactobacillus siliginis]|uniref:UPF0154 protein IV55_GL002033 n=1 Tax=Furfurilactobacillus siliginis TaxID=348151 RepID=A0A0R2L9G2_9LACO|nr:YneF family protein [Furfurilactobacillus siliginis]KRN95389.1 hypothetical protein IV55_GL002033 [Furfurilactobacillus siliginis]GEK28169.1 UPF0154 protein [Furfurilactobacillus siliginis]